MVVIDYDECELISKIVKQMAEAGLHLYCDACWNEHNEFWKLIHDLEAAAKERDEDSITPISVDRD